MSRLTAFFTSTLGLKYIMALTGLGLIGFVITHMLGNLQIFLGPDALNHYAQRLADLGPLLWLARGGLLMIFAIHMLCAFSLTRCNAEARPEPYALQSTIQASWASRYMIQTGIVILIFVIYHILHFTLGVTDASIMGHTPAGGFDKDVYWMVVSAFRKWPVSLAYILAQFFLAAHLWHGASSLFQSLGLNHSKYNKLIRCFGPALATLIFVGNSAIPIGALTQCLKLL